MRRGYGTRDPCVSSAALYRTPDRTTGSRASPFRLLDRTRVHGSINILWIKTTMTIEECAARYLADLTNAAAEIVRSLQGRARRR